MAAGKKFYWIKLRTSFLDSEKIDFLLSQKNGANYVVIYQMLCLKTINSDLKNFATVSIEDISKDEPMVKILEEIFKEKGLHEFKKAEFAHLVKQQISTENDISDEIKLIINDIKQLSLSNSLV